MKGKGTRAGKTKGTRARKTRGTRSSNRNQQDLGARTSGPHRYADLQVRKSNNADQGHPAGLSLDAVAESDPDGWLIRAPRVGIFRRLLEPGAQARPGERIGTLEVLQRRRAVVLPAGTDGIIVESMLSDRTQAVEYGQPLARIRAGTKGMAERGSDRAPTARTHADAALPEGCFPVLSPIDGIFYSRPTPGAPPFVETGALIEAGRTIGLVEAMKSFNAIAYGDPGLPARAAIVEIRAKDAGEVRQGAILLVVRPA